MATYEYVIVASNCETTNYDHSHSRNISDINSDVKANIPPHAVISSVQVYLDMNHDAVFGTLGNADLNIWLCYDENDNSGENLYSGSTSTSSKICTADITSKVTKTYPFNFNTSYTVLAVYYDSTTRRLYHCDRFSVIYTYSIPTCTVTWKNADGTTLETDTNVEYGTTPTYNGATPTKASTAQYNYTFSGWSPSVGAISGDTTFTAQFTETVRSYVISASGENGTVTGGGTYEYNKTVTLTATPNSGYKIKDWLMDGSSLKTTSSQLNYTVTANASFTVVFEPIYVTYDTVFSYRKWYDSGISVSNGVLSDSNVMLFSIISNSGAGEATATSPYFPVEAGKSYKIDIEVSGDNWDVYIFFCDANGTWVNFSDSTNRFSSNGSGVATRIFTAPEGSVKAQIRCDANGSSNEVQFSDFRIYPADCTYMSDSLLFTDRTDVASWSIPTPTREGYTFKGWNTKPDGTGTTYTSDSTFPSDDLVLYSQWEEAPPEIKSVSMIYMDKQISETNKVPCGEGFVLSVELV